MEKYLLERIFLSSISVRFAFLFASPSKHGRPNPFVCAVHDAQHTLETCTRPQARASHPSHRLDKSCARKVSHKPFAPHSVGLGRYLVLKLYCNVHADSLCSDCVVCTHSYIPHRLCALPVILPLQLHTSMQKLRLLECVFMCACQPFSNSALLFRKRNTNDLYLTYSVFISARSTVLYLQGVFVRQQRQATEANRLCR